MTAQAVALCENMYRTAVQPMRDLGVRHVILFVRSRDSFIVHYVVSSAMTLGALVVYWSYLSSAGFTSVRNVLWAGLIVIYGVPASVKGY